MSKCIIFYFSATGNTEYLCYCYKKYLEENQIATELHPLETLLEIPSLDEYDYLGIAYPVFALNTPTIVRSFIQKIPKNSVDKKCFVFATCCAYYMNAVKQTYDVMLKKGYKMLRSRSYEMPSNYTIVISEPDSIDQIEGLMTRADVQAQEAVREIIEGVDKVDIQGGIFAGLLSHIIGFLFEKIGTPIQGKNLHSTDKCIKCGLCIRCCPTGNITMENQQIVFDKKCIVCCRCYNICPVKAIVYKGNEKKDYRYTLPGYKPPVVNAGSGDRG